MLPISELVKVARSVDERGSSPLALIVAREWGYDKARFVRSSANHVFACQAPRRAAGILRFRPDAPGAIQAAHCVAETANRLASDGVAVAPAISTPEGKLAARVELGSQPYVATMFSAAAGEQVDSGSLTPEHARSWGKALALFHEAAMRLEPPAAVPSWMETVAEASQRLRPHNVRDGGADVVDALRRLDTSAHLVGVVHGDPELDNVVWDAGGKPYFVDVDDVSTSWFAADICFALRDFIVLDGNSRTNSRVVEAFSDGYRETRPLADAELEWLPLFRRAHAIVTLAGLERVLAESVADDWPQWAKQLYARVGGVATELRTMLARAAG